VRILLVEDEPAAAALLAKGLREHAYAVDVAIDGEAALEQSMVNDYDLLVVDRLLPGADGLEICRQLRARGTTTPVLLLTARGDFDDRVAGLDAGADDYLPKPYHFPELLARIRALLRRGPALVDSTLQVDDLRIDTRGRRVWRDDREVPLTTKEYALLEFLARHHGEVMSRTAIAAHVWDDSFDPLSNLIDVYVQRLRRKIDDGFDRKLIGTVRGAGYVLAGRGAPDGDA